METKRNNKHTILIIIISSVVLSLFDGPYIIGALMALNIKLQLQITIIWMILTMFFLNIIISIPIVWIIKKMIKRNN